MAGASAETRNLSLCYRIQDLPVELLARVISYTIPSEVYVTAEWRLESSTGTPCNKTASNPFTVPGQQMTPANLEIQQSITSQEPYLNFSFEELRLAGAEYKTTPRDSKVWSTYKLTWYPAWIPGLSLVSKLFARISLPIAAQRTVLHAKAVNINEIQQEDMDHHIDLRQLPRVLLHNATQITITQTKMLWMLPTDTINLGCLPKLKALELGRYDIARTFQRHCNWLERLDANQARLRAWAIREAFLPDSDCTQEDFDSDVRDYGYTTTMRMTAMIIYLKLWESPDRFQEMVKNLVRMIFKIAPNTIQNLPSGAQVTIAFENAHARKIGHIELGNPGEVDKLDFDTDLLTEYLKDGTNWSR